MAELLSNREPLSVKMLHPSAADRWDQFVLDCPNATFFHRAGWQTVIERAFGHKTWFLYAEGGGQIRAVLPLAQINSPWFGHTLCSLPFCVYGGIATVNHEAGVVLDQAAQELASRLKVDHLEYRGLHARHPDWLLKNLYVTFRKNLHPLAEQNMLEIPRKQRAMVRKGIAASLHSVLDFNVDNFYHVYSSSLHRLGTPTFSKTYFQILQQVFGENCEIVSVCRGQETISSVLVFYFRDQVLPYYGGGTNVARSLAGNDFMYWEVMRRACERGFQLFDFGRSKLGTGSYNFKKNWGFEPQPLIYECQLHQAKTIPDNNPLNPKYAFFINAWRKIPLRIANTLGPHIVRHLG